MRVTVYAGLDLGKPPTPLAMVMMKTVEAFDGWSVADVLEAGGHMRHSSFTLVTPEVEADVNAGHDRTITGVFNLLGLDERGVVRFDSTHHITWDDFVRAVQEGLYAGDSSRVLVHPYGVAGGLEPDGLWAAVQFLFDNRDLAAQAMAQLGEVGAGVTALVTGSRWVTAVRRRQIARSWRTRGFTAARTRWYLGRQPQWDPTTLEKQLELTPLEARLVLTKAGYEAGKGDLWRLSAAPDAQELQAALERVEAAAYENLEDGWDDNFPLELDDEA